MPQSITLTSPAPRFKELLEKITAAIPSDAISGLYSTRPMQRAASVEADAA